MNMNYFLGFDGGGTKTACLLVNEKGQVCATAEGAGASWRQHGARQVAATMQGLAQSCLREASTCFAELLGVCAGLPLVGEDAEGDSQLHAALAPVFPTLHLVNDTEVGWAGSLACEAGVNVVAGTGSIAYGCDESGKAARSGGWTEQFGDEGSCYWLALQGMQLFTKQADGRSPRGPLYEQVRREYALENDFDFIPLVLGEMLPYREKTAAFQKLLSDAADEGDAAALMLYTQAGEELALMAQAVKEALNFTAKPVAVSYSGGAFKAGEKILRPFEAALTAQGMRLSPPRLTPVQGAALLALRRYAPAGFAAARATLLETAGNAR